MAHPLLRPARRLVAALAALLLSGPAVAQIPSMPGSAKGPASEAAAPQAGDPDRAAELRSRLGAERRQLELRSMVEGSFADHGIVIAFAQRDVHRDTAAPLAVRVVHEPAPARSQDHRSAPPPPPPRMITTTDTSP